jgi:GPI ethanolamine phosphate transferase 2/3 subunit F
MPLVDPVTMSSSAMKANPSSASKPLELLQPVQIRSSFVAQVVRHVQPVLLSSLFLLRFNALVADPVLTMETSLAAAAAIQLAYAVVCLPVAGSQQLKKPKPGEKKKADGGPNPAVVGFIAFRGAEINLC